jgi:hypothetical protein
MHADKKERQITPGDEVRKTHLLQMNKLGESSAKSQIRPNVSEHGIELAMVEAPLAVEFEKGFIDRTAW